MGINIQCTVANEKLFILPNLNHPSTQKELAESYGITQQTMSNYIRIANMIPELEDLVDTGIATKDTALAMMRNLSDQEQKEFIDSIPTDKKYTQKQMDEETQKYKNRMCDVHTYHNEDEILQDLLETNIRQRGDIGGSDKQIGKRIKELERIYGSKVGRPKNSENNSELSPQEKIAQKMDMDVRTLRNYKMLADMIPELDDLQDENSKLRALISNNFGRRKNDPVKDRKALATYVELKGYKHGEMGNGRKKTCQNGTSTLDEIAKELNMSTTNLKRALRIERNLTDSMKELLDIGEITKTFASDTIASLSENHIIFP